MPRPRRSKKNGNDAKRFSVELLIAAYAAVLSTVGFGWQIWEWRQARPSLEIEAPSSLLIVQEDGKHLPMKTRLRFINRSSRTVTVYGVEVFLVEDWLLTAGGGQMTMNTVPEATTRLPIQIEGGGVATWERTEEIGFERAPLITGQQKFSAGFAVRLQSTAGVIESLLPITITYVVAQPN